MVARVHNIYRERDSIQCSITHKNTLRKVIMQHPSSPKALTCLKFYKCRMRALFLYKVRLKIHNHHRIIFWSALSVWKSVENAGIFDDEENSEDDETKPEGSYCVGQKDEYSCFSQGDELER